MKLFSKCIVTVLAVAVNLSMMSARADVEVSAAFRINAVADFHAPLATHGAWIEVGSYGRCWRPAHVAVGWRPYCYGHWVWTDCGWYWVSDEPWAWACYHYGSWAYDSHHGWIWMPGIEWAPAWVTWRVGGGYCGWAPLAPHGIVVAPQAFVFVEARHFHNPVRPSTVIVNNSAVIGKTTVSHNIKRETRAFADVGSKKVVVNDGPGLAVVENATGKKIRQVPVREAVSQTPVPLEVRGKINEPGRKQTSPADQGRTVAPNDRKSERREPPDHPTQVRPPDKNQKPPVPGTAPAKPSKPGKGKDGKGGGKGPGKDKD
jgi:hypothetical protein